MSLYNERYDDALSKAPWVSKVCDGRTYLFKYASHPDRAGYLFAATDLQTVTFEELSATSVPTRLSHIATTQGQDDDIMALGFNEQQAKTEDALSSLSGIFDNWGNVAVERDVDDYFDAVFVLTCGDFKWIFQMTELRGRQPLAFISKQLLAPWASLLGLDRGVPVNNDNPAEAVAAIISDAGVARALRRITGAGPPRPTPTPQPATRVSSPAPLSKLPPSPCPARTPRRMASPEKRTPVPPPPSHERTAQTVSLLPPSSPTPVARRKVYDYAAGILPSSDTGDGGGVSSSAPSAPASLPSPLDSSPPVPPTDLPPVHIPTSSAPTSSVPSSTLDPLIPTLEGKKRKKKKDAKKIEEEEEAEANRRRAEMKRRMASGGTGRLGRRRA